MCGIAGFLSTNRSAADLRAANDCLRHRGPDAGDVYFEEGRVGLGHRRLSIQDLSAAGAQPMHSHDGRYAMIYNGEVYNGPALRERLPGTPWRGHSDSEIILELFVRFGPECFGWLNGMFAIAIWDKQEQKLTLARDPIGIKPLFWSMQGAEFLFSSELKSIKNLQPDLSLNRAAVPLFLHLSYIPAPHTIYTGVYKAPTGSYAEVRMDGGAPEMSGWKSFWRIEDHIAHEPLQDEARAKGDLRDILFSAVERQLISDVPFGTFLSGGIDSSVVTAVASKVTSGRLATFSIAVVDGKVNEAPYAAAVAKHLGTDHHELPIREADILDMVPSLLGAYDEPFGDTSAFPTMLVSKLAREHVTVALSGDGGDEQFMGYGTYVWAQRLQNPVLHALRRPLHVVTQRAPAYYRHAGRNLAYPSRALMKSHVYAQDYFSVGEVNRLLQDDKFFPEELNRDVASPRALSAKERQSFWDLKHYLPDDLLVKVDRASMQYSLETRVPLLDLELVAWSLNLHENLKVRDGGAKYLLKQVLYDLVPQKLFDRPKWGFGIPLEKALRGPLKPLVEANLSATVLERHGLVHPQKALRLKERFYTGDAEPFFQLWLLTVLHWWLEENMR